MRNQTLQKMNKPFKKEQKKGPLQQFKSKSGVIQRGKYKVKPK